MPSRAAFRLDHHDDIMYPGLVPFVLVHFACLAALWSGVTKEAVAIAVALYFLRMFAITAGYHRYFSHRSYRTSRWFQFVLALIAQSTTQKSVLWWAAKPGSITGIRIPMPTCIRRGIAGCCTRTSAGSSTGGMIRRNSDGWGTQRYRTGDDSRNNWVLALLTLGEGWHNNHHAYQRSARQGFRWYEIDMAYYALRALGWAGIVWDLRGPPAHVVRNEQRRPARLRRQARSLEQDVA